MPRDTRNRLHIYYMEKLGQEKHVIVYPKSICGVKTNWRDFNYPMAFDLYNQGMTEVCKVFNVLTPEDISSSISIILSLCSAARSACCCNLSNNWSSKLR